MKEHNRMRAVLLGIDTLDEPVVYMRRDCPVCRAEGFRSRSRIRVKCDGHSTTATLYVVDVERLRPGEIGLSYEATRQLEAQAGMWLEVEHAPASSSFSHVRGKIYGTDFSAEGLREIIRDVSRRRYSDIELSAFVTACAQEMSDAEVTALTQAMVDAGGRLQWAQDLVLDKHCVGGLPGNRTTPLVVAIVCAAGLIMPKTSSRAITSPAGTADTVETLMPVSLSLAQMRTVVEREGGCLAWGGAVALSPADDILIRVERALDIDTPGQLVASVLSKKIAAGATHVVIDMPVGPTAKVRSQVEADRLSAQFRWVTDQLGLHLRILHSDGSVPVGRGIGPALEAWDVLAVLQNEPDAPADLRQRALDISAQLLLLGGAAADQSAALELAQSLLSSGAAWRKFSAIAEAQGGLREPVVAPYQQSLYAANAGVVIGYDNRLLSRLAKVAGAPAAPGAGLTLLCPLGTTVERGAPVMTLHAESQGELDYAVEYWRQHPDMITINHTVPVSAVSR